jgi:hypothetical protein
MTRLPTAFRKTLTAPRLAAVSLTFLVCVSCISVNVGFKPPASSKGVVFRSPASPFQPLSQTRADGAWKNKANGNSISFHSACQDPADPPLEAALKEMLGEIEDLKTIRNRTVSFNAREAIDSEVEGKLDGIPTRIRSLVFKKNDCLYTITHIGLPAFFEQDRERFEEFLGSFQAP